MVSWEGQNLKQIIPLLSSAFLSLICVNLPRARQPCFPNKAYYAHQA